MISKFSKENLSLLDVINERSWMKPRKVKMMVKDGVELAQLIEKRLYDWIFNSKDFFSINRSCIIYFNVKKIAYLSVNGLEDEI